MCTAALHWAAADPVKILCRLVEGDTLNSPLSELCSSGTAGALAMQQHEQQVLEVAVQLVDVGHVANNMSSTASPAFH